jgi:hypothetical protein
MSKSNWSRYTAVGLASIALLGVVFGFGIYSYWIGNLAGYNEAEAKATKPNTPNTPTNA